MATLRRAPWTRIVVSLPALAALLGALVGLVGGGPRERGHHVKAAPAAHARPPARHAPAPSGPQPLQAGARHRVAVPRRLEGRGAFLTVSAGAAHLRPARRRHGVVALTFDDGPGPQTAALLHRLERLHAKASFFVVGYAVNARPKLLMRERRLGMTIGNHSWAHPPMRALGPRDQRFQIEADEAAIQRVVGYRPLFFRPPDLSFNLITAREIEAAGLVGALYTIDTRDWSLPGARTIVRRALQVRPGGVIAMHDAGGNRRQTLEALGPIVRGLRRRHLEPVTLDALYRKSPRRPEPGP